MPKSLQRSVGWGGRNLPQDVVTVQYLLNCVPSGKGGPFPELAVDGLVGPKTIGAIRKFQRAAFGHADGRVDPNKRTIQTLLAYDPYPNQAMGLPGAAGKTAGGFYGKGVAGQKTQGVGWGKDASGASWGKSGLGGPWGKGLPGKSGGAGKSGF
jgi:peptidoglycan hydrolase-like protein with peptidoglycan-binding domain